MVSMMIDGWWLMKDVEVEVEASIGKGVTVAKPEDRMMMTWGYRNTSTHFQITAD